MNSTCTNLQNSLDTLIEEGITTASTEWSEEVTRISKEVTTHVTTEEQTLERAEAMVNIYVTEDMKRDIPTGKQ